MKKEERNKVEKKIVFLILVGILLCLGIVLGVSYAWWTFTVTQESVNTINSDCLKVELVDENPITLQNAYPITDAEAKFLTPYTFTIQNTCSTIIKYDVNLEILEAQNRLKSDYVAIQIGEEEKKLLNIYEEVTPSYNKGNQKTVEARRVMSGNLGGNENISYSIKLWMDETVPLEEDAMNKSFISKISVNASQAHTIRLVDYIMSDTSKDFEKFSQPATSQTPALTDYRYTGSNPNNYVCFGSEKEECPEENLYRIIGVIPTQSEIGGDCVNRVKLIKANVYTENESGYLEQTSYTSNGYGYQWNSDNNCNWGQSTLQLQVLNGVYVQELEQYQKYIASTIWYLGALGDDYNNSRLKYSSQQFYNAERSNELVSSSVNLSFLLKVGLMYPSDFGYAKGDSFKEESISENMENSWLYNITGDYYEWLITPNFKNSSTGAAAISHVGIITPSVYGAEQKLHAFSIRPAFYLKENVQYESREGTKENPYRITIYV